MLVIGCTENGNKQNWSNGLELGRGTKIEVAVRAVFFSFGAMVEEQDEVLVANTIDTAADEN